MTDLETRILEIEADDDTGRLARALEAVIESCEDAIRIVDQYFLPDDRDHANRDYADMILDVITEALGENNEL